MIHHHVFEWCCVIGAIFIVSNVWIFLRVLRPLHQFALQAERLQKGDFAAFEQDCGGISEIAMLRRAMVGMVGHVRRAQEQCRAYADQLSIGQENERKRIAHELHDETIQGLIAVTQSIDLTKNWLQSDPARAATMLGLAREQAVMAINTLRNLIGALRPPALEELGLVAALKMQFKQMGELAVEIRVKGVERRLSEVCELTLFRATQEAMMNVCRHSGASHAEIEIDYRSDAVLLCVRDDGRGFEPLSNLGDLALRQHYGLLGIQERVSYLSGSIHISSRIGQGTTVEVCIPAVKRIEPSHLVRDPVCSVLLEPEQVYGSIVYEGMRYHFCCPVCQGAFQKDPALYLAANDQLAQPV